MTAIIEKGLGGNVTDKRTGLEIRVTKERLQSLGGSFKWISQRKAVRRWLDKGSHKAVAGGSHSSWQDENSLGILSITAAKKKKLSERNQGRDEFTTSNLNSTYNNNKPNFKEHKERKGQPEVWT